MQSGSANSQPDTSAVLQMEERSLFRAKRINHCKDFVARVALEAVDSAGWKQQLRVKSAGQQNNSLVLDKGVSRQPLFAFA
jgi:hypothetical protein